MVGFSFYGNPNSTKSKSRKYFQASISYPYYIHIYGTVYLSQKFLSKLFIEREDKLLYRLPDPVRYMFGLLKGIEENLELMGEFYPGWTVRVYFDLEPGSYLHQDLCRLACSNPALDMCYVRRLPSSLDISRVFAMIWRFFPVVDPQVGCPANFRFT